MANFFNNLPDKVSQGANKILGQVSQGLHNIGEIFRAPGEAKEAAKLAEHEAKEALRKESDRAQFEADRAHAEAREDSAIQRAVKDSLLAGISPSQGAAVNMGGGASAHIQNPFEPADLPEEDKETFAEILRALVPFALIINRSLKK